MAESNVQAIALARVYATSILDLAEAAKQADALLDEIRDLSSFMEKNPEFAAFLTSPSVDVAAREKSLERLFRGKCSDMLLNALQVLNRKGRGSLLGEVARQLEQLHAVRSGNVEVFITTAVGLAEGLKSQLASWVKQRTGKAAVFRETVDSSVLGGLIVQIGDEKFDQSVRSRLLGFRERLLDRASREIHGGRVYWSGSLS